MKHAILYIKNIPKIGMFLEIPNGPLIDEGQKSIDSCHTPIETSVERQKALGISESHHTPSQMACMGCHSDLVGAQWSKEPLYILVVAIRGK